MLGHHVAFNANEFLAFQHWTVVWALGRNGRRVRCRVVAVTKCGKDKVAAFIAA